MKNVIKIARRHELFIAAIVAVTVALVLVLQLPGSRKDNSLAASIEESLKH